MGICNRTLIDCAQMFGRPLLHSRYQLRGYHASFGTSTNRYKFSSDHGNMSSVNVVVDNNEAEALSLLAKRRRKADVIFGLYESPITGQNSIHTRRAPNEALQYETLPCPVKIGNFTQQNHHTLGRKLKNGFAFQKIILLPQSSTLKVGKKT